MMPAPDFDEDFRARLEQLFRWRRDVRRFRSNPIDPALIERLVTLVAKSFWPSCGFLEGGKP